MATKKIARRTPVGKSPKNVLSSPPRVFFSPNLVASLAVPHVDMVLGRVHLVEDPLCELEIATELLMGEIRDHDFPENEGIFYLARRVQRHVKDTRTALDEAMKRPAALYEALKAGGGQ